MVQGVQSAILILLQLQPEFPPRPRYPAIHLKPAGRGNVLYVQEVVTTVAPDMRISGFFAGYPARKKLF